MQTESRVDDLLQGLASDYASYLVYDTSLEWNKLDGITSKLSSNLDDFTLLLESLNLDTSLCVDSLLPQIVSHFDHLKETFQQIDRLEKAVQAVDSSVSAMEVELNRAESQLGSESVFKTVLRPFLKPSNPPAAVDQSLLTYKPVKIFNSDELWKTDGEQ